MPRLALGAAASTVTEPVGPRWLWTHFAVTAEASPMGRGQVTRFDELGSRVCKTHVF